MEKKIEDIYQNKQVKSSIEKELKYSIKAYKLNKLDFFSIIDGMMMDAEKDIKFPTKKELNLYCDRVAVAVGYLSIKIFGLSTKEKSMLFILEELFN